MMKTGTTNSTRSRLSELGILFLALTFHLSKSPRDSMHRQIKSMLHGCHLPFLRLAGTTVKTSKHFKYLRRAPTKLRAALGL